MSAAVETMAFAKSGGDPWHGLGKPVSNDLTAQEMVVAAGLDWKVEKKPLYLASGKVVPGKFGLVRETDESILSVVGNGYKPVQNEESMSFFKDFVEAGSMSMETAGSLHGGRYTWGLAKIGKSFDVGKGDRDHTDGYLFMAQPHIHGKAMIFRTTGIRVVCWNTFSAALGQKGHSFRMPHSMHFNEKVKESAKLALNLASEQIVAYGEAAKFLSKKKAAPEQVEEFFFKVLKFDAEKREQRVAEGHKDPRLVGNFQQALLSAPGQDLPSALGTWWGAFNAVTYVVDHEMSRSRDIGLKNAFVGRGARIKESALKYALEAAA